MARLPNPDDLRRQANSAGPRVTQAPSPRLSRLAGTIFLAGIACATGFQLPSAYADDFKVGVILPLTGPGAGTGRPLSEGAKATVALANVRGGIGGLHVEMIACDTQSVEQQAVLCARRLTSEDKVNIVLGAGPTPQTLAIEPTIDQVGVPLFTIAGGTVNFRPLKKWVFKGIATNEDVIPAALEYLKQKNMLRIAIIRDNGAFGSDVDANVKAQLGKFGMQIVSDEVYSPTDTDMSPQVTRIAAARPDAIFNIASNPTPAAIIVKKVYQLGLKQPVIVSNNLQSNTFAQLTGSAASQVLFIGMKALLSDASDTDPLGVNFRAFRTEFDKLDPGVEIVAVSTLCADSILLTQAAAKPLGAKALDHTALLAALETLTNVPGIQGRWTFSPTSHESSLVNGVAMVQYQDGHWVKAH